MNLKMTTENFSFNAEIGKVLNLVINSIYTNRDIFLRELVSNAEDAISKLRFLSMENQNLLPQGYEPKIIVDASQLAGTLTIKDNGIGMDKNDLVNNLGTIASSGTGKFQEALKNSNSSSLPELIGQFGVGFYSSFIVADKVSVKTRKAGTKECFLWESSGVSDFSISQLTDEDENFFGTEITLHIKEGKDKEDYLDKFRVENILKTYSNHISSKIILRYDEGENDKITTKEAIWQKRPQDVSDDEYKDFYKSLSWMPDEPFLKIHSKIEGAIEYSTLLFIPSMRPFDLYSQERKSNVKLYVKKVFITEDNAKILPEYLRFVRGVVDSSDLPLNISRETFQNNDSVTKISKSLVKKILSELKKKLTQDFNSYKNFWEIFGNVLKEGLCRPDEWREQLLEICLFRSSKKNDLITLEQYVAEMKPDQPSIYYITAESYSEGLLSPQMEIFKKNETEVLILTDTVDDFWVNVVLDFQGRNLESIVNAGGKLDEDLAKDAQNKEHIEKEDNKIIIDHFKQVLSEFVKDVKISYKLLSSPVCLSKEQGAMSIRMEKYLVEQKQLQHISKRILEINPENKIIKEILENIKTDSNNPKIKEKVLTLFDCACLSAGDSVRHPNEFASRVFDLFNK